MPGDRPLISIGYKCNYKKVLFVIDSEDTGIKKDDITYLYKYHDQFENVYILHITFSLGMYKLFGYVN